MLTIDGRCDDPHCSKDMYRMVGHCRNCGTGDILLLFTSGHRRRPLTCPVCGCYREVCSDRLATDDEFPDPKEMASLDRLSESERGTWLDRAAAEATGDDDG
jgi:hypothetical protein